MDIIYLIPIRKGSKGIPGKNMKLLGGKPLVSWVIDSLIASKTSEDIWLATNAPSAVDFISLNYPSVRIFHRSEASSTDTSPTIEVVLEFLQNIRPDPSKVLVVPQATVPFTRPSDFLQLKDNLSEDYDSYVSCRRVKHFVWHEDGYPLSYSLTSKPRRQDYKGVLYETGAFHASRIRDILSSGQLLSGRIKIIESTNPLNIDIDTHDDWNVAEAIANLLQS